MDEKRIIQIASDTKYFGLKNIYTFKTSAKNKICGDNISIEIEKNFKNIRFEANSCIFTQASAAILANNFLKIRNFGFKKVLSLIEKKLKGETISFPFKIKELDFLLNKKNKNRKECITLPYNAILKVVDD